MLRKRPGFTFVNVVTLALGMGANTTMFSTMDAMLLHPLSVPELERLVAISENMPHGITGTETVAPADYLDWTRQSTVFDVMAAYQSCGPDMPDLGAPEHLEGARVYPG